MEYKCNNNIQYQGFVTIKILKGNKTIRTIKTHNAGTTLLFKVLSSVLCGNNESVNMPKYFDLGSMESDGSSYTFKSNLANRVALNSKVIENFTTIMEDNKTFKSAYGASFTVLIPSIQILEQKNIDTLRLYSLNYGEESLLAQVELLNSLEVSYDKGYNYMIEWVMTFENAMIAN